MKQQIKYTFKKKRPKSLIVLSAQVLFLILSLAGILWGQSRLKEKASAESAKQKNLKRKARVFFLPQKNEKKAPPRAD